MQGAEEDAPAGDPRHVLHAELKAPSGTRVLANTNLQSPPAHRAGSMKIPWPTEGLIATSGVGSATLSGAWCAHVLPATEQG